jgi:hypothetical protein
MRSQPELHGSMPHLRDCSSTPEPLQIASGSVRNLSHYSSGRLEYCRCQEGGIKRAAAKGKSCPTVTRQLTRSTTELSPQMTQMFADSFNRE